MKWKPFIGMIGILDRDPDGSSLYIIICLIQDRSSPAVKNELFSNPDSLRANPSVGMIFHMLCMYMWRIFKETFGTGKRSDAVRSDVRVWLRNWCERKHKEAKQVLCVMHSSSSNSLQCVRPMPYTTSHAVRSEVRFTAPPFRKFLEF